MIILPHEIYVDGGVVAKNPSKLGGTWCYVWVDKKGFKIKHECGLLLPKDLGVKAVTNNHTELYAAMQGLLSVQDYYWRGVIYTDSKITLQRITYSNSFKSITDFMRECVQELKKDRLWRVGLLKGHPNKKDLIIGIYNLNI